MMAFVLAITVNAQMYNVGTSNTTTDYFGNQTTTHRDRYGNTTGTSTSSTDYFAIGTSTTSTDYFGNTTTTHRDRYGNTTGTDRSSRDYYGNTNTTSTDPYGNTRGTSTTSAFIGTLPYQISAEELEAQLPERCSVEVISGSKEQTNLFILCSKDVYDEAESILRKLTFVSISESDSKTPLELSFTQVEKE